MMNESAIVESALEAAASSPRVGAAVAVATASIGAAAKLDLIQGLLSIVSMGVGIVTGFVVLGIQLIRLERAWRARSMENSIAKE